MRRSRGQSLVETLTTLAVAGVLSALGLPALAGFVADAHRTATVNALIAAIQLARSEAALRSAPVTLCASDDGLRCRSDWQAGWILFVNEDDDTPARVDPGEMVLRGWAPTGAATVASNRRAYTFRPFDRRATNGTLTVCAGDGAEAGRAIVVGPTGRPRVARSTPDGKPVSC